MMLNPARSSARDAADLTLRAPEPPDYAGHRLAVHVHADSSLRHLVGTRYGTSVPEAAYPMGYVWDQ